MANRKYANVVQLRKAQRSQENAYKKRSYKAYTFRYHKVRDKDVIDILDKQENRSAFVKDAIKQKIKH